MLPTAIITFREFLEAFLIVGVFLGISRKLQLKREVEIGFAASIGFIISLVLATVTYFFGDFARGILSRENAEILESYILIFSGFFIAYVIFSLHALMQRSRGTELLKAHSQLQKNAFDFSLFLTIVMLVVREGFEIALFTASTSLFAVFLQNMIGLLIGFIAASVIGLLTFFSYIKFPIGKVFKVTEYMIILLGASLVQTGITELLEHSFAIHLGDMMRFPLSFLPVEDSVVGHFIRSFAGIDREFSVARLLIMGAYVALIYFLFKKKPQVWLFNKNEMEKKE